MAESVGSVHVELTTSTVAFKREMANASQSVQNFSDGARKAAQSASSGTGATNEYSVAFGKMGEKVKGAAASIAGFSQVAVAMGEKVNPAIKGMGTALGALLSGGFTPFGLAIGAATAGIAYFVSESQKAQAVLDESAKRVAKLSEEYIKLRQARASFETGKTVEQMNAPQELQDLDATVARAEKDLARLQKAWDLTPVLDRDLFAMQKITDATEKLVLARNERNSFVAGMGQTSAGDVEKKAKAEFAEKYMADLQAARDAEEAFREAMVYRIRAQAAASEKASAEFEKLTEAEKAAAAESKKYIDAVLPESLMEGVILKTQEEIDLIDEWERKVRDLAEKERAGSARFAGAESKAEVVNAGDKTFGQGFNEGMAKVKENLLTISQMGESVAMNLADSFGNAFAAFATGAQSAGDAFKSFAAGFLRDIAAMMAKQLAMNAIVGLGSMLGLTGFAEGGSFQVRGTGGTDSQLVAFKASPGEQVDVSTPGQRNAKGGGGNVNINVHNYANAKASVNTSEGPNGKSIDVIIEDVVAGSINRGGKVHKAMQQTYGSQRRGRRQ